MKTLDITRMFLVSFSFDALLLMSPFELAFIFSRCSNLFYTFSLIESCLTVLRIHCIFLFKSSSLTYFFISLLFITLSISILFESKVSSVPLNPNIISIISLIFFLDRCSESVLLSCLLCCLRVHVC